MKKKLLPLAALFVSGMMYSQVGVGTHYPHKSSQLDVRSTDKGILIPRIALSSVTDNATIQNGNVESLLVYNTTDTADIRPGYFYWFRDRWTRLISDYDTALLLNTSNVKLSVINGALVLEDSEGEVVSVLLSDIASPETVTTIVQDATTRIYTYENEAGATVDINVIADVTNKFEDIINNTNVQNILNEYLTKVEGNVTYDGNNFVYYDENGDIQIIDITELVKAAETVTTIVQDATTRVYTYENEAGDTFDINVIADVTNKFEDIINNTTVQNILNEYLTKVEGNVTYDGNNFVYYDENGDIQIIDITELVKAAETVTTIVQNATTRIYTYENEAGDTFDINVIADVTNKFEDIINNTTVQNILNEYLTKVEGNVTYDGNNFVYYDENGDIQIIDITELVKAAETVTTIVQDATTRVYTYENEAGDTFDINVIADVTNKFEDIINNTTVQNILNEYLTKVEGNVTYDGTNFIYYENGVEKIIDITALVKAAETVTTIVQNATTRVYTYENEAGDTFDINVIADVTNKFEDIINNTTVQNILNEYLTKVEGNVTYDGTNFIYYENGVEKIINITELVKAAETVTTIVQNATTRVYTYENEAGDTFDINVIADVTNKFEDIINNTTVQNILNEYLTKVEGNVTYDGTNFIYYENGVEKIIDITALVKAAETVTTIVQNATTRVYTYENEAGDTFDINVIADVTNKFEDIINNTTVQNILNEYLTKVEGNVTYDGTNFIYYENGVEKIIDITALVKAAETVTTIVQDATTRVYTYENEAGDTFDINVIADVTNKFEDIINNTTVQNILNEYLTKVEGNVTYDGTNFIYYENGVEKIIDITALVKAAETVTTIVQDATTRVYTYENEAGDTFDINVIADVTNKFKEIINNPTVQDILNEYLTKVEGNVSYDGTNFIYYENGVEKIIDITALVKAAETVTTIVQDATTRVYTYENEAGDTFDINVIADVTNKFEDIINNTTVQNILNEYLTKVEGNVTYDGDNFVYYDENGDIQIIDITELVKAAETTTTLVNNNDGTYTYTNEKAVPVTIDIPASLVNNTNQDFIDYITNLIEEKQTLTSLVDVVTPGFDQDGQEIDVHTLTYKDEKGIANPIDISVLVKGVETLTTMTYDPVTHSLSYTNELNIETKFDLVDMVGDIETLTKLELDIDEKKLVYTDENTVVHVLDLAPIIQEPWYSTTTNQGAISNDDNIYTKGWVGIGYTTPSDVPDEKLRVNGSITTVNSNYADYVFEDYFDGFSEIKLDYKFKDLDSVEDFIKTNRHLPGITPIHDLVKTDVGYAFNLSELSIQLLEKTEELYLHVIDQKNQIEQKDAQIQKLEEANQAVQDRLTRLESLLLNK